MPSVTASSFSPTAACLQDTVLPVVNFNWPSGESTNHWLEINQQINPGIIHISQWTCSRSRLGQSSPRCRRTCVECCYCLLSCRRTSFQSPEIPFRVTLLLPLICMAVAKSFFFCKVLNTDGTGSMTAGKCVDESVKVTTFLLWAIPLVC